MKGVSPLPSVRSDRVPPPARRARHRSKPIILPLALLLAACSAAPGRVSVYQSEVFEANETFSRLFDAGAEAVCEAARRALLSQGYLLSTVKSESLSGSKNFQPASEVHVQIVFNVVCVAEPGPGKVATAYVNAIQDRYALKRSPNSATVGLSAIGSVSIPLTPTEDSLVKVASETIPAGPFYDRFFALVQRNLQTAGDP